MIAFRTFVAVLLVAAIGWVATREPDLARVRVANLADLERELETLRVRLRIPGMSAAVADDGHVAWARGFGMADVERRVPVDTDALFHLASVTKTYASTILLQLVAEERLDLNAPVADFGITMERSLPVRVWHLLSHTSDEPPGTTYRYDGNAFGELTRVIERVTGRPFAKEIVDRIITPLQLTQTAPNPGDLHGFSSLFASFSPTREDVERERAVFAASGLERGAIEATLVKGYARQWGRSIWPSGLVGPMRQMPHGITLSTSGGMVASAQDVARFSIALDDEGRLLPAELRRRAWTAVVTPTGQVLPYGLGWFVQEVHGNLLAWHYGHMLESSSLIVKLPGKKLTFVILANSDGLSRWRGLGDDGNVLASPAATLFMNWVSGSRHSTFR